MVNAIEAFDAKHLKPAEEIPAFRPGDTVEVNVKIKEGNNSRLQAFTGVVFDPDTKADILPKRL